MKVMQTVAEGSPEVLQEAKVDPPTPLPTEVLVSVRAAGVNAVDWKIRSGMFPPGALGRHPFVQGWDVAGVVESGPRVTRFAPGDRVFGLIWFPRPGGGYGEMVTAPARQLALMPKSLSFVEAAALPLAGLTAWQTLVSFAEVSAGDRVLVSAAGGGVGHLATQIAAHGGTVVTGTARAEKHEFLRSCGVSVPVDYTTGPVSEQVGDQDVVLDLLGGEHSLDLVRCLRPGGLHILAIGVVQPALQAAADECGVRVVPFLVEPDGASLESLADLVETGNLKVHVDRVFKLNEVAKAHEYGEAGRTTGKIVLHVAD
ncbi:MAG: NADPH:quinone reductase [Pseudonocardiales bacterium]|nr:MAG: NADPH:quinone reductase [Pseudonocardiales bacterium]